MNCWFYSFPISFVLADDESDNNPHDFEGNNSDLELGNDEQMMHFKGHNSFTQMQVISDAPANDPCFITNRLKFKQGTSFWKYLLESFGNKWSFKNGTTTNNCTNQLLITLIKADLFIHDIFKITKFIALTKHFSFLFSRGSFFRWILIAKQFLKNIFF